MMWKKGNAKLKLVFFLSVSTIFAGLYAQGLARWGNADGYSYSRTVTTDPNLGPIHPNCNNGVTYGVGQAFSLDNIGDATSATSTVCWNKADTAHTATVVGSAIKTARGLYVSSPGLAQAGVITLRDGDLGPLNEGMFGCETQAAHTGSSPTDCTSATNALTSIASIVSGTARDENGEIRGNQYYQLSVITSTGSTVTLNTGELHHLLADFDVTFVKGATGTPGSLNDIAAAVRDATNNARGTYLDKNCTNSGSNPWCTPLSKKATCLIYMNTCTSGTDTYCGGSC